MWFWVSLPWATFGIRVEWDGNRSRVVEAAPIAQWTLGKTEEHVLGYYRRKGAEVVRLR